MNFKQTFIGIFSIAMVLLMASSVFSAAIQSVHNSGLPKTNEILYKAYPGAGPDAIVDEFLLGTTDWIGGPGRLDLYNRVVEAGEKVSIMTAMSEFAFMAINCRDYKETSGAVNLPLNDSKFRLALSYIYGVNDKQTDIFSYVQAMWTFAIDNPVHPSAEPWYDESIKMPNTDYATAWTILTGAGYSVSGGVLKKGATVIRNLQVYYSTGALYWSQGPGVGFVRNFNAFISYIGATGPVATLVPVSFETLVTDLLVTHDYDFICIGLTNMGIYVDWLYDLLNSANDAAWGWNFAGIHDALFDTWTESILTDLNVDNVIGNASLVQARFVYTLFPWFPISSGKAFCTVASDTRGELMNIIPMPSYGPQNGYSFMAVHWKTTWPGGTVKFAMGDTVHTMNPYNEDTLYGWQMLDRSTEGLLSRDPVTLKNMPWIATEYSVSPWVSIPELGITNGSMATFYIRQDVLWQDGVPVTAYDCVNNMRLLRKYKPGRYSGTWAMLVYEEADGPYKFNVYFYTPSLYWADNVAGTALLASKHVTDKAEATYGSIITGWDPAFNTYKALMGVDPPAKYSFMKQIVGCGPFVFDYFDKSLSRGRVQKYDEYFVSAPAIGSVVGEWRIDPDTAYTYKVLVQNIAAKENSTSGELVPITVDVKTYEDDVLKYTDAGVYLGIWNYTYLTPHTTATYPGGQHTIKVEIYESGTKIHTYIHKFVVCPRQDTTTYSGDLIDFKVDIKDIFRAAKAYGSYPGSLKWDPASDVDDNFKVDIKDIFAIAKKYGWHWP